MTEPDKLMALIATRDLLNELAQHMGTYRGIYTRNNGGLLARVEFARNVFPGLIEEIQRLTSENERLTKELAATVKTRDHYFVQSERNMSTACALQRERDELRRDRAIEKFSDVKLRSIEAMIGTLDHSLACDDEDWRDQLCSSVAQLVEQTNELRRERDAAKEKQ